MPGPSAPSAPSAPGPRVGWGPSGDSGPRSRGAGTRAPSSLLLGPRSPADPGPGVTAPSQVDEMPPPPPTTMDKGLHGPGSAGSRGAAPRSLRGPSAAPSRPAERCKGMELGGDPAAPPRGEARAAARLQERRQEGSAGEGLQWGETRTPGAPGDHPGTALSACLASISSTACFVFVLFAFLVLPLSMTFHRMKFLEDCPIQPLIPMYLLVGRSLVSLLLCDSTRVRRLLSKAVVIDDDDDDEYPWRQNAHKYYLHLLLSLFLFLWLILGNYWIFSVFLPDFIPPFQQPQNYCDKTLYLFVVGVLMLSHAMLGLLVLCRGCVYPCSRWGSAADED
ncbi:transmembrane protein 272 [Choloepus didactylus]|uniref:transmembrane protein 272 n=1 Tax=Choloepus didactylus TaxID=27675 RepID=UPI00189CE447|nr:transmembrane protein 272 [Choloepus didactylus]